jgi:hypothetical protein
MLLAGCAMGVSEPLTVARTACPPLVQYDRDLQRRAAEDTSRGRARLFSERNDYIKLRDACRAFAFLK